MDAYWKIRFYHTGEHFSMEDSQMDQLWVYAGLYGVPSSVVWFKTGEDQIYVGMAFRLKIKRETSVIYSDVFIVKSVTYDLGKRMFVIVAEGRIFEDFKRSVQLPAKTLAKKVGEAGGETGLSALDVIKKFIMRDSHDRWLVVLPGTESKRNYVSLSFDPSFSLLDLLTKICRENRWEFYLRDNAIFIGEQIMQNRREIAKGPLNKKKHVVFGDFMNLITEADVCEPGRLYKSDMRVVWVIYNIGFKISAHMNIMLYLRKNSYLSENNVINTLYGYSRRMAREREDLILKQEPLVIGKISGDFIEDSIDNYQAPIFGGDYETETPFLKTTKFKTTYTTEDNPPQLRTENTLMTSPFVGDGVGVLYPQQESHRVLFTPQGDREMALVGPGYWANEDVVPKRDSANDYRLQLPAAVIYIKENGDIIIEQDTPAGQIPSGSGNYIKIGADSTINIEAVGEVNINGATTKLQGGGSKLSHADHKHMVGNMGAPVPAHLPMEGTFTTEGD